MAQETASIAGRVDKRDFDFLNENTFGGATTISEKLRLALSLFRKFNQGTEKFEDAMEVLDNLLGSGRRSILQDELSDGVRSELVHICMNHLPAMLALLAAQGRDKEKGDCKSNQQLRHLEEQLLRLMLPMVESFLRICLTKRAPLYNPALLEGRLDAISEVSEMLLQKKPDTENLNH